MNTQQWTQSSQSVLKVLKETWNTIVKEEDDLELFIHYTNQSQKKWMLNCLNQWELDTRRSAACYNGVENKQDHINLLFKRLKYNHRLLFKPTIDLLDLKKVNQKTVAKSYDNVLTTLQTRADIPDEIVRFIGEWSPQVCMIKANAEYIKIQIFGLKIMKELQENSTLFLKLSKQQMWDLHYRFGGYSMKGNWEHGDSHNYSGDDNDKWNYHCIKKVATKQELFNHFQQNSGDIIDGKVVGLGKYGRPSEDDIYLMTRKSKAEQQDDVEKGMHLPILKKKGGRIWNATKYSVGYKLKVLDLIKTKNIKQVKVRRT